MKSKSSGTVVGRYTLEHWRGSALVAKETVENQLFNEGQYAILDVAFRNGAAPASWYIGLMSNGMQTMPAVNSTLLSLSLAGGYELTAGDTGYARQAVARSASGWPTLVPEDSGEVITTAQVTFQNTGGLQWPNTVRWMFLTTNGGVGDTTGKLISIAQLSQDRALLPGDRVLITYSLLLKLAD